jgi:hypothetical protein
LNCGQPPRRHPLCIAKMSQSSLYKFYGWQTELARWAQSNPGCCPVCCNLDIRSWAHGIPISTAGLPKSRENCTFCDILFKAMQTPYFSSLTTEPRPYIRATESWSFIKRSFPLPLMIGVENDELLLEIFPLTRK